MEVRGHCTLGGGGGLWRGGTAKYVITERRMPFVRSLSFCRRYIVFEISPGSVFLGEGNFQPEGWQRALEEGGYGEDLVVGGG